MNTFMSLPSNVMPYVPLTIYAELPAVCTGRHTESYTTGKDSPHQNYGKSCFRVVLLLNSDMDTQFELIEWATKEVAVRDGQMTT